MEDIEPQLLFGIMIRMVATTRISDPETPSKTSAGRTEMSREGQGTFVLFCRSNSISQAIKLLTTPNPDCKIKIWKCLALRL